MFKSKRWQKLAGIVSEETTDTEQNTLKEGMFLGVTSPGIIGGNPFGEHSLSEKLKEMDMDEQIKPDVSPESMWPSREDAEEDWAQYKEEEFEERMLPGWEDDGFNAQVINDIADELKMVDRSLGGLRRAEMLSARLEKAIEALRDELRSGR